MFNARSINNCDKLNDLRCYLSVKNPDIVCITETWLQPATHSSLLTAGTSYSVFRKDRVSQGRGGGVCILVNRMFVTAVEVPIPVKFSEIEVTAVDVLSVGGESSRFRLIVCCRPPSPSESSETAVNYAVTLCRCIEHLLPINSTVVICGDFNYPKICWDNNSNVLRNNNSTSGAFLQFYYKHALIQFVNQHTRLDSTTRNGSILDLVFNNDSSFIQNVAVTGPFSTSDHCVVEFNALNDFRLQSPAVSAYDFVHANWAGIVSYLECVNFYDLFARCDDVGCVIACFYDILYDAFKRFVPVRLVSSSSSLKNHYPFNVRRMLRKKAAAWRVYRNFRTAELLSAYKLLASQCRDAIRNFHAAHEEKIISSANVNKFYRYANRKFANRTPIGPLKCADSTLITDPKMKAELLQSVFSSMFTADNGLIPSFSMPPNHGHKMSSVCFRVNLVKRAIARLRTNSKGGPDGLPPLLFKTCVSQLSAPPTYVYNLCFQQNYLAPDWLRAYITPMFKKGDPTNPLNYRPIALTCTISKIMERIINDQLLTCLLRNNFITKHQHAFLKSRSTASNLLECTEDWTVALTNRLSVDVIYVDFSRAFDSIVFAKLTVKLGYYGIEGKLLAWITAFLHNHTQCVVLENCFSTVANVDSGVIQGSVLGPTLFLLFINDITSVCSDNVKIKLFADDVKLYSVIDVLNCNANLQESLDCLVSWANDWQLSINISKCNVLSLRTKLHQSDSSYSINGIRLVNLTQVSDLGILIDSKLAYNKHISNIITKASQRAGVFFRGFTSRSLPLCVRLLSRTSGHYSNTTQ
jgi:exonuclease III